MEKGLVIATGLNGVSCIRSCTKDNYEQVFRQVCQDEIPVRWNAYSEKDRAEIADEGVCEVHGVIVAIIWLDHDGNYTPNAMG